MKIKNVALLALSVFALAACGGEPARKEATEQEFASAAAAAVEKGNPYKTATMTAFYQLTQNGQKTIDETDMKCTYTWGETGWNATDDKLGNYTHMFVTAPVTMVAPQITNVMNTLIKTTGITDSSVKYYVEGGLGAKLTGKLDASILARGATGSLDMTVDFSFNDNGFITKYENLNKGTFTYNNTNYNYNDHTGFTITYAA